MGKKKKNNFDNKDFLEKYGNNSMEEIFDFDDEFDFYDDYNFENEFEDMVCELEIETERKILNENLKHVDSKNIKLKKAYDLMKKAINSKDGKKALKYAKEAYETSNECIQALLYCVKHEYEPLKRIKLLNEGIKIEEKRLKSKGYFSEDKINNFSTFYETEGYLNALFLKLLIYIGERKFTLSKEVCYEILKLDKDDRYSIKHILMAIYAYLEDKDSMMKFYKECNYESEEMLFAIFILYLKLENYDEARKKIKMINNINENFLLVVKDFLREGPNSFNDEFDYIDLEESEEIILYLSNIIFLIESVPTIYEFLK